MAKERIKGSQFKTFDPLVIAINDFCTVSGETKASVQWLYESGVAICEVGKVTTGTVVEKTDDGLKLDINYKSLGFVSAREFNPIEYRNVQVGSVIEVFVERLESNDGIVSVSSEKAKAAKVWENIGTLFKENKPVKGVVVSKVKGGLYVDIGVTAFLPGSQIDTQRVADFDQWIGQEIQAYIVKIMPKRGNVIISRRKLIYEQKSEVRKEILNNLVEGQIIEGIVKNITKYGAFIDISSAVGGGSVDGLLHITDMSWRRIDNPEEMFKVGQVIKAIVLTLDKINEKVSLGYKQLMGNPWANLPENIAVGSVVEGKIISIKEYGIFVEIIEGVEGLVHISEISWTDRISDLHKHFKIGQMVTVTIVSLERKGRRMSLSIKQIEKNPWDIAMEKFVIGQKITGKVTNIADFGFFVQVAPGIDGMVHISDISWSQHIDHPSDIYAKGDAVDVVIIDINKQKRKVSLSVKAARENPWSKIGELVKVGDIVTGKVVKIVDFGAFIRLKSVEVEAFMHASECSDIPNALISDIISVDSEYNFKVIKVSPEEQKIGLSLRTKSHSAHHSGDAGNAGKNKARRRDDQKKGHSTSSAVVSSQGEGSSKKMFSLQLELKRLMEQQEEREAANEDEKKKSEE